MSSLPSMKTISNRVLRETGIPEVASFASGNRQSTIAYDAVLDGYADIWMRNRWEWQRYEASIALSDGVSDYNLPANFQRLALPPWFPPNRQATMLKELSPDEFHVNLGLVDPTQQGQPLFCTIDHNTITVYPTPSSNFVTTCPTMTMQYFLDLPARLSAANENLVPTYMPAEFYDALVNYAKSRLKQHLEYPDFEQDMQLYEKKLQILINRNRRSRTAPRFRNEFDGIMEW